MKMKKVSTLIICVIMLGVIHSCGLLFWREIKCRDFEFQDELKWYPGNVGEVITFSNEENEMKEFVIREKYISHRAKYYSDTGCDCLDLWVIMLSSGSDTIRMYGNSFYIEKQKATRHDYFYVRYNNKLSRFKDGSIVSNYAIENKTFAQVMIFEHPHTENNQFKKVVIAPEIGIIELIEANGNIWRNIDLETKLNIEMNSFKYSETTCG